MFKEPKPPLPTGDFPSRIVFKAEDVQHDAELAASRKAPALQ